MSFWTQKLSFESHIRSIATSASSKHRIMKHALCLFADTILVSMCFWSFLLPVLEYCSPVWMSSAASHLGLLDHVVSKAVRHSDGLLVCDLEHRHRVTALYMFYKIHCNHNHALETAFPQVYVPAWLTRLAVSVHSRHLAVPRCRTVQSGSSFVPACVQLWNS